jgi:hypothetical protein
MTATGAWSVTRTSVSLNPDDRLVAHASRKQAVNRSDCPRMPRSDRRHLDELPFDQLYLVVGRQNTCLPHPMKFVGGEQAARNLEIGSHG